jgi:hypothetical protein
VTWSTNADSQAEAMRRAAGLEKRGLISEKQRRKIMPDYECSTAAKCGTYRLFSIPVL